MESTGDKKQKIIQTAKKVFAEKSFFDATLEEISELSGVKKSTIYYYFESKLDLLMAILETAIHEITVKIDELMLLENRKMIIASLIDSYFEFFTRERELVLLLHRVSFDLLSHEEACRRMEAIFVNLQALWGKVAKKIGSVQTKSGVEVSGDKVIRMISASVVGYCVEELKRGEHIGEGEREFFREIFTAF